MRNYAIDSPAPRASRSSESSIFESRPQLSREFTKKGSRTTPGGSSHQGKAPPPTMENILVTAVIPTRNRPALVKRAIASVRSQGYEPIDIPGVMVAPGGETAARGGRTG